MSAIYEPGGDSGKGYYGYVIYSAGLSMDPDVAMYEAGHAWNHLADEYYVAGTTYTGGEPVNVKPSPAERRADDPGHLQLAQTLARQILTGALDAGSRLDSGSGSAYVC